VLKAVLYNVTSPLHITVQMGPADVLDHSAQAFTFGGKLCIDATIKMPEESGLNNPGKSDNNYSVPKNIKPVFNIENILKQLQNYPCITGMNLSLLEKDLGLLIVSIIKDRSNVVRNIAGELSQLPEFSGIRCLIFLDNDIHLENISSVAWLVSGNIDPVRDCYVINSNEQFCLAVDGTSKNSAFDGFKREWPSLIVSGNETILKIDKKWSSLGLGEFLSSPSLLFKTNNS
jgi:4-hydroxy-3-polyprenylbenzoate decarboxylase